MIRFLARAGDSPLNPNAVDRGRPHATFSEALPPGVPIRSANRAAEFCALLRLCGRQICIFTLLVCPPAQRCFSCTPCSLRLAWFPPGRVGALFGRDPAPALLLANCVIDGGLEMGNVKVRPGARRHTCRSRRARRRWRRSTNFSDTLRPQSGDRRHPRSARGTTQGFLYRHGGGSVDPKIGLHDPEVDFRGPDRGHTRSRHRPQGPFAGAARPTGRPHRPRDGRCHPRRRGRVTEINMTQRKKMPPASEGGGLGRK